MRLGMGSIVTRSQATQARMTVSALAIAPVKGLRVASPAQIVLDHAGVRGDRRLYLIDAQDRMVNGKRLGALVTVTAELDEDERRLTLTFADGEVVTGAIETGETHQTTFFSRRRPARLVLGDFSEALSARVGERVRLVQPADGSSAADRGEEGTVSLLARPSVRALAAASGVRALDGRRFRMSIEIDGGEPFEEDRWVGRELHIGEVRIAPTGHVGRCLVTSRHPETGDIDAPTLDGLRALRAGAATTEPLALGLHGTILRGGVLRVGDPVEVRQL